MLYIYVLEIHDITESAYANDVLSASTIMHYGYVLAVVCSSYHFRHFLPANLGGGCSVDCYGNMFHFLLFLFLLYAS